MEDNTDNRKIVKHIENTLNEKYVTCAKMTDTAIRLIEHHYGSVSFELGSPLYIAIYNDILNTMNAKEAQNKAQI